MNPTKPDTQPANLPVEKADAIATRNTPIQQLMAEYARDGFDFSDMDGVKRAALRYVQTMPDSQVRTLLYALASPVWRCSCGSPSLPGVLHRADRPCYRVEENQSCN
jgi:hypothetical protein